MIGVHGGLIIRGVKLLPQQPLTNNNNKLNKNEEKNDGKNEKIINDPDLIGNMRNHFGGKEELYKAFLGIQCGGKEALEIFKLALKLLEKGTTINADVFVVKIELANIIIKTITSGRPDTRYALDIYHILEKNFNDDEISAIIFSRDFLNGKNFISESIMLNSFKKKEGKNQNTQLMMNVFEENMENMFIDPRRVELFKNCKSIHAIDQMFYISE